jgi:hypothetical protein
MAVPCRIFEGRLFLVEHESIQGRKPGPDYCGGWRERGEGRGREGRGGEAKEASGPAASSLSALSLSSVPFFRRIRWWAAHALSSGGSELLATQCPCWTWRQEEGERRRGRSEGLGRGRMEMEEKGKSKQVSLRDARAYFARCQKDESGTCSICSPVREVERVSDLQDI